MKLIQFRFKDQPSSSWLEVGHTIEAMFRSAKDTELTSIFVSNFGDTELTFASVAVEDVARVISKSIEESYSSKINNYSDLTTIKSNCTCRLVAPEFDGLLRIRLPSEDSIPSFAGLDPVVEDVSHLLIETDLFDYM